MNTNDELIKKLQSVMADLESQKSTKQPDSEREFIDVLLTNCAKHLKDVYKQKDFSIDNPEYLNAFTVARVLSVALAFDNESLIVFKLLNKINEL